MELRDILEIVIDNLDHPLVVVLFGGLLTAFLGPYLTRSWEARKAGFELKTELIHESTSEIAKLFSTATRAEMGRDRIEERQRIRDALTDGIQEFTIFSKTFEAKLRTYFPGYSFDQEWNDIFDSAYTFAHLAGTFDADQRREHMQRLWDNLDLQNSRRRIVFDEVVNRGEIQPPGGVGERPYASSWQNIRSEIEVRAQILMSKIIKASTLLERRK